MRTALSTRAGVHADRLSQLRQELRANGWAGILITDLVDVGYLCGLDSSNAALLVTLDHALVVTDFRYMAAASQLDRAFTPRQVNQAIFHELGQMVGRETGGGAIAYSPTSLTHRAFLQLTEGLSDTVTLRAVDGAVGKLRVVKSPAELDTIRRASALLEGSYEMVAELGLAGRSEREVAWLIERQLREAGAEALSFDLIVAGGANGALPHHRPGDAVIPDDTLVTVDIGCKIAGYCSDCTRTFGVGNPSDQLRKIYAITLEAQQAALAAVVPGAIGRDVDAIARDVIDGAGFGDCFGHGLGHGVGLQVHEAPRLARTSSDQLEPGMVVTVEPGIYLPDVGGVRIEDLVIVTQDSHDVLTAYPKELICVP